MTTDPANGVTWAKYPLDYHIERLQRGEWIANDNLHHAAMRAWKGLGPHQPGVTLNRICDPLVCESCYLGGSSRYRFRILCTNPAHYELGLPDPGPGRHRDGITPETLYLLEQGRVANGRTVHKIVSQTLESKRESIQVLARAVAALERVADKTHAVGVPTVPDSPVT